MQALRRAFAREMAAAAEAADDEGAVEAEVDEAQEPV